MPTIQQIERVTKEYAVICKEPVKVEFISDTMYVFGSELACLRLHYRMTTGYVKFSENLRTWYYSKDVQLH